jgi:ABC-type branched-subunit amino acid transport system substrate-binding protein
LISRREDRLRELCDQITEAGGAAVYAIANIDDRSNVMTAIDAVRGQLDGFLEGEGLVFLTGVSVLDVLAAAGVMLDDSQSILVDPLDSVVYRSAASAPENLVTMDAVPFSVAFREAYGYDPDVNAIGGYISARFIDAAVSVVEGRFTQRDALHRALAQARKNLP